MTDRPRNELLVVLRALAAAAGEQNALCTQLLDLLRPLAESSLRGYRLPHEILDDVLQETVLAAALGSSRFRGTTPAEAKGWATQVLRSRAIDFLRRERRYATEVDDASSAGDQDEWQEAEDLATVLVDLRSGIKSGPASSGPGAVGCFDIFIESLRGEEIATQIEKWDTNSGDRAGARNRIDQYRHRGKTEACKRLSAIRRTDRITSGYFSLLFQLFRCLDAKKRPSATSQDGTT